MTIMNEFQVGVFMQGSRLMLLMHNHAGVGAKLGFLYGFNWQDILRWFFSLYEL